MNTKAELRAEIERLIGGTIFECYEILDIYCEFLFEAVKSHKRIIVNSNADDDAKIIIQIILTKSLHLRSVIEGVGYISKDGVELNTIIDPTVVASLIRNIYETTGMFNLIYRSTKNNDEKTIIHLLWVCAGLNYRQRFKNIITTKESQDTYELELQMIEENVKTIETNNLYKILDDKNKGKITQKLKDKDYLMHFEGTNVNFLSWQKLTELMGIKNGLADEIYTYFSLYAHPSNVAVFQYRDMFGTKDEAFLKLTTFNLKNAFYFLSIFIADYLKLFPTVQNTFDNLDIRDQILINKYNTFMRGIEYSINDSWKEID
jgi:hypothetical protein